MPLHGLMMQSMLNNGFYQYPETSLYKAATHLTPAERPTVPVRVVDPKEFYDGEAVRNKTVNGFTTPEKDHVYISKHSPMLKDPKQLAGVMAHEQRHVMGDSESPAYALQAAVLKRLGSSKYMKDIDQYSLLSTMLKGK